MENPSPRPHGPIGLGKMDFEANPQQQTTLLLGCFSGGRARGRGGGVGERPRGGVLPKLGPPAF